MAEPYATPSADPFDPGPHMPGGTGCMGWTATSRRHSCSTIDAEGTIRVHVYQRRSGRHYVTEYGPSEAIEAIATLLGWRGGASYRVKTVRTR